MDTIARQSPPQSGVYTTIATYAAANALSLAVFLILYHVSAVLADFRDPMLYAFLCSIALRGPKDWLVERMDFHLSQDRSLVVTVLRTVASPYSAAQMMWAEGKEVGKAFQSKVKEIRAEYQRSVERDRRLSASTPTAANTEATPFQNGNLHNHNQPSSTPSSPSKSLTPTSVPQTQPFTLTVYAKAGLRTFTSRKDRKKRRKRAASAVRKRPPAPASNRLMVALLFVTLAWAGFEWIRDSWSRTAHMVLLTGTTVILATIILRSILVLTASWGGHIMNTPAKAPATAGPSTAGSARAPSPRSTPWTTTSTPGLKQPVFGESPRSNKFTTEGQRALHAAARGFGKLPRTRILTVLESPIRSILRRNIHAIVTLVLIAGLLLGTAGTAAFLSIRIVNEARGVLVAARDAFPAAWPGISAVTPMLADEFTDGATNHDYFTNRARSLQEVASGVQLPAWLESYRLDAMSLAQRSLPGMAAWLEGRIQGFMVQHNLTDTLWDARLLFEAAQGPRTCSDRERSKLLVALAKTEVAARKSREVEEKAAEGVADAQRALSEAISALSLALGEKAATARGAGGQSCTVDADHRTDGRASSSSAHPPSPSPDSEVSESQLAALQEHVVAADAVLSAAKEAHKATRAALDDAERARRVSDGRSQLCIAPETAGSLHHAPGNAQGQGLLAGLGARLGSAYTKLFWQLKVREGFSELHGAVMYAIESITQRSGATAAADLSRLQRLAQVAAVPLFGIGRAAAASVGTTTAAAVMGSLGLFKLGLGVVHVGVQAALFLTLLYYLLAAQTDPLARAVALLPLPPAARFRAAEALNAALGGVFMSMLKLAIFHGMFAWVTFRMFGAPMAYTTSVASAAFALLPFVPTYSVALPGCAVVAFQGRVAAAVALLILHFSAYYIGDTVVLEDSGGHPFMMSLAILGGLWAFSNPLLGCLLGPTLLSLLSALGALHTELMGSSVGGGQPVMLSPKAAARMPPPVLTTPEEALQAPATLSPKARDLSPSQSPQKHTSTPHSPRLNREKSRELSPGETLGSISLAEMPEMEDKVDDEVQSAAPLPRQSSVKKSGFAFLRKKENVKFDSPRFDVGL